MGNLCADPAAQRSMILRSTPGITASFLKILNCHINEPIGFTMEKNLCLSNCIIANSAARSAMRFAFFVTGHPNPSGRAAERRTFTEACASLRLANEKVLAGGVECIQLTERSNNLVKFTSLSKSMFSHSTSNDNARPRTPTISRNACDKPAKPAKTSKRTNAVSREATTVAGTVDVVAWGRPSHASRCRAVRCG